MKWFKKLFGKKEKMQRFKKFDVLTIAEGESHPHEQHGLQASSESELRQLLNMTGEKILKVIRVYDGDYIKNSKTNPEYLSTMDEHGNIIPPPPPQQKMEIQDNDDTIQHGNEQPKREFLEIENSQQQKNTPMFQKNPTRNVGVSSRAKYYNIGNVEIKEQDGKIYQKQWVEVPSQDSSMYRVVSDKTNKIIPLDGKHIEVKKWVVVESNENDDPGFDKKEIICG